MLLLHHVIMMVLLLSSKVTSMRSGSSQDTTRVSKWHQTPLEQPVKETSMLRLTLALRVSSDQIDTLTHRLNAVSDPTNQAFYGKYLDNNAITSIVQASDTTHSMVTTFLLSQGFTKLVPSLNRDYLFATAPMHVIEALFNVTLHHYQSILFPEIAYIRSGHPYVMHPALAPHVALIPDLHDLPTNHGNSKRDDLSSPRTKVTNVPADVEETHENSVSDMTPSSTSPPVTVKTTAAPAATAITDPPMMNHPIVLAPTTWRGNSITIMALLRCMDGSFRVLDVACEAPITHVLLRLDPVSPILASTTVAFKPFTLFNTSMSSIHGDKDGVEGDDNEAIVPKCRPCTIYPLSHYTRGQLTRDLCNTMIASAAAPAATLVCLLTLDQAVLATPSELHVTSVFGVEPSSTPPSSTPDSDSDSHENHKDTDNARTFIEISSSESQCLAGVSEQNCSKVLTLMPDVTPSYLRQLYNVPEDLVGGRAGNRNHQAVSAFLAEHFSPDDLSIFAKTFLSQPVSVSIVRGPNDPSHPTGEASLDVQTILGIAPNITTTYWSVGGLREDVETGWDGNQEPFLKWIMDYNAMDSRENPPLVMSVSYDDNELTQLKAFTDRMQLEFIKTGLLGRTLLFAAGDDGCGGQILRSKGSDYCTTFRPEWPSTDPYVTSVGGTIMGRNPDSLPSAPLTEVVSDVRAGSFITTGGGFSFRYPRPTYQQDAVTAYLNQSSSHGVVTLPDPSMYNAEGRGYPDVSGIATNYLIKLGTRGFIPIAGTSASTPAVAALLSLVNDVRLSHALPPLGFVNPLLYALLTSHPHVFHDVTHGNNQCSAVPEACCATGFEASPGWDPTTGVGTLNVTALIQLLGTTRSPFITSSPSPPTSTPEVASPVRAVGASTPSSPLLLRLLIGVGGVVMLMAGLLALYRRSSTRQSYASL